MHRQVLGGRFKSQLPLDERALAACLAYVDLNPVRARMAKTPEDSDHASVKQHIEPACASIQPQIAVSLCWQSPRSYARGYPAAAVIR